MEECIDRDVQLDKKEDDHVNISTGRHAEPSTIQFDDILKSVSEFGRRQKLVYLLSSFCVIVPSSFQIAGLYFISGTPEFHCETRNVTCPDNKCCDNCTKYVFNGPFNSTTTEWNLICDRAYINATVQAGYYIGMLVGSLVFGAISDVFGRRFCILLCSLLATLFSLGSVFVHSVVLFTCLRAASGACITGLFVSQYVYILELVGPSYRTMACNFGNFFWIIGELGVILLAYFIHDWRALLLVTSIPIALSLLLWRVLLESPRWLVVHDRLDEACSILKKYAGKSSLDSDSLKDRLKKCLGEEVYSQRKTKKHTPQDLLRTSRLRKRTLVLWFNWMVVSLAFYGFLLYVSNLVGNPYLNLSYMYLSDAPAVIIAWLTLEKFGRRVTHCVLMMTGGVTCLLVLIEPQGESLATTVLAFIGRNLLNMAFSVLYLYSSELYPTSVRNLAVGTCSTSGRIGAIGAPYIVMLVCDMSSPYMSQLSGVTITLPITIFGALSIVAGLMILSLPETLNSNVPQTMEEMNKTKEYYGLIWMGRRVSCLRSKASDKKSLLEVPAPFYGTSTNSEA